MIRKIALAILGATLLFVSPSFVQAQEIVPRFEPSPCPFNFTTNYKIDCGYLLVREDRSQPNSRTIKLGVAVVRSASANPQPDPFIYLTGGPGGDIIESLEFFVPQFQSVLATRDVIFFDQRGTGWSRPALHCPEVKTLLTREAEGQKITGDDKRALYILCRDRFIAQGVDLTTYNTNTIAADTQDVWQTLGYKQVNLYSVSYATILAETIMRDHPQGVRSVILDSFYPLQVSLFADAHRNYARIMKTLFANCAADLICRLTYPDLDKVFYQELDRLTRQPVTLTALHPFTKQPFNFTFDGVDLLQMLVNPNPRNMPAIIFDIRDGDYSAVIDSRQKTIEAYYDPVRRGSPADNLGMRHSVACSQNTYYATPEQLEASKVTPESVWSLNFISEMYLRCQDPRNPNEMQPLQSDIPTLAFVGEYDPSVTPDYGDMLKRDLKNSFVYFVRDAGHGVVSTGGICPATITLSFLSDPNRRPNDSCLDETPLRADTKFIVRGAVMSPLALTLVFLFALVLLITLPRAARVLPLRLFTLRQSFHSVNLILVSVGAIAMLYALYQGDKNFLRIPASRVIEIVLPLIALAQAAFIFSPEDEPALEITLTMRRPLAWTLLERFFLLAAVHLALGIMLSAYAATRTGEPFALTLSRWLPPLLFFSALAVCVTLIWRRAMFGLMLSMLLWVVTFFLGELMIKAYPVTWLFNPYLPPLHAFYSLNRLFIILSSGMLLLYATRFLKDEEKLLLGASKRSVPSKDRLFTLSPLHLTTFLPISWQKTIAIVYYELLMQLRRPALGVLIVGLLIAPIIGALLARSSFTGMAASVAAGGITESHARALVTANMIPPSWMIGFGLMSSLLFFLVADTIPKDRQLGVRELLDSLPVTMATYLNGKILSVWLSMWVGVGVAALLGGIMWWFSVYPFNLQIYVEMWSFGIGSLALINSALGVLLTAAQPNTRRAILIAVGLFIAVQALSVAGYFLLDSFWGHLIPSRPSLTLYYLFGFPNPDVGASASYVVALSRLTSFNKALLDVVFGFAEVAVVWLITWWWMKRRQ